MTDTDLPELSPDTVLATIRRRGRAGMSLRMLVAEVEDRLEIDRSEARRLLRGALRALEQQGEVVLGRGKRYFPADVSDLHPGRYRALAGGGFVVDLEAGDGPPVAIPPSGRRGALPGDRVLVRIETPRKRSRELGLREGVVVRVVERRTSEVVGVWVAGGGRPHVRPLGRGQRFSVEITSSEVEGQPDDGELVVVSVDQVEGRGEVARGALLARLGRPEDAGAVDRAVLRLFGIAEAFDPEVAAQAEALPGSVGGAELAGRWDLRDRPAITIDGETARDFDDAVSARRVKGGVVEVEVHIADVAHYVRPGGLVDAEARRRGTSVYLPGLCVPMLPEKLSNDLCSLREGVDRLTFTVRFRVAGDGRVSRAEAHDSVIRSRRRCTYTEVFGWLERPRADWPEATGAFADSLEALAEAADRLGRARRARGSLDFDLAEPQILLDPEGRVVGIEPSARNRAHRLIEELMVAANTAVAMLIMKADQPCLHRVHDEPDPAKIETLAEVVGELGLRLASPRSSASSACASPGGPASSRRRRSRRCSSRLPAGPRSTWWRCSSCARWRGRSTPTTRAATTRWRPTPTSTSPRRSVATRTSSRTACCGPCSATGAPSRGRRATPPREGCAPSARPARCSSSRPRRPSGRRSSGRPRSTCGTGWARPSTGGSRG